MARIDFFLTRHFPTRVAGEWRVLLDHRPSTLAPRLWRVRDFGSQCAPAAFQVQTNNQTRLNLGIDIIQGTNSSSLEKSRTRKDNYVNSCATSSILRMFSLSRYSLRTSLCTLPPPSNDTNADPTCEIVIIWSLSPKGQYNWEGCIEQWFLERWQIGEDILSKRKEGQNQFKLTIKRLTN